jgi:hypothetical protein
MLMTSKTMRKAIGNNASGIDGSLCFFVIKGVFENFKN